MAPPRGPGVHPGVRRWARPPASPRLPVETPVPRCTLTSSWLSLGLGTKGLGLLPQGLRGLGCSQETRVSR